MKFLIQFALKDSSKKVPTIPTNKRINISVHIPTRAEPFAIVKECINSIQKQLDPLDEIIVIDNNHTNVQEYSVLRDYCNTIGVHFIHRDYVKGYKAGALNIALENTGLKADYIFIVDCDYVLSEGAICKLKSIAQMYTDFNYLQFPQDYKCNNSIDVNNELSKYFDYNLKLYTNRINSLGTGSLCLIKKSTLNAIGQWPTNSITEDAQMGINVQKVGGRGLYVPKRIGQGILPQTIKDFIKQRKRWTYGNAEVLCNLFYNANKKTFTLSNLSQLTTWLNFSGLSIVVHIILLIMALFNQRVNDILALVYIHYFLIIAFNLYEFNQLRHSFKRNFRAFLIHWNFFWISSLYWLPAIWNIKREFIRTPKIALSKNAMLNLPKYFLLLNLVSLMLFVDEPMILIFGSCILLLEIWSKIVLTQNYIT